MRCATRLYLAFFFLGISTLANPIHEAVARGDLDAAREILARDPSQLDQRNENDRTPLSLALEMGREEMANFLLDTGADAARIDRNGATSLHWAALGSKPAVFAKLLAKNLNVNAADKAGQLPLDLACARTNEPVALFLIEHGSILTNAVPSFGGSLHMAAATGLLEVAKRLLAGGANVKGADDDGLTPLALAAKSDRNLAVTRLLIERGADINAPNRQGWTPLHWASISGAVETARILLRAGAPPNPRNAAGLTPLSYAADRAHPRLIALLLQNGASVQNVDGYHATPLHNAANAAYGPEDRYIESADLLLRHGADLHAKGPQGGTPLHSAVNRGRLGVAALLLKAGAEANRQDNLGATPLHYAAQIQNLDAVKMLINAGADVNIRTAAGLTPLAIAKPRSSAEITSVLAAAGARADGLPPEKMVGPNHTVDRIRFVGANAYSESSLRWSLGKNASYIVASHPSASKERLLETIERSLLRGYSAAGYDDAEIGAAWRGEEILVTIDEGPRITMGKLEILAPENFPREKLLATLTNSPVRLWNAMEAASEARARLTALTTPSPYWRAGAPISGRDSKLETKFLTAALALIGYGNARFEKAEARTPANTLDLTLKIIAPDSPALLDQIEVLGNKINSAAEILETAGLKLPMAWADLDLERAAARLWESGRLHDFSFHLLTEESSLPPRLRLRVEEDDLIPPMRAPLTREQAALLRFATRFGDVLANGAELIVEGKIRFQKEPPAADGPRPAYEMIFSRDGFAYAESPSTAAAQRVALRLDSSAIKATVGEENFFFPVASGNLGLFAELTLLPSLGSTNGSKRHIQFGFGVRTRGENEPIFRPNFSVSPAIILESFGDTNWNFNWAGPMLVATNTNQIALRINGETGELSEFRLTEMGPVRDVRIAIRTNAIAALASSSNPSPSRAPFAAQPATTLLSLAARSLENSALLHDILGATQPNPALPSARKLLAHGGIASLDKIVANVLSLGVTNLFIPPDDLTPQSLQAHAWAFLRSFSYDLARRAFPVDSWPVIVAREVAFVSMGPSQFAGDALKAIYDTADIGPAACSIISAYLLKNGHPAADRFAARGLERLDLPRFLNDIAFLSKSPLIESLLLDLRAAFDKLEPAGQDQLARAIPPGFGDLLFRGASLADAAELAHRWETSIAPSLRAHLTATLQQAEESLSPDIALARADEAFRNSNMPAAIKWLRRSAAQGDPQAAMALAGFLERGQGVERDFKEAARFYEIAARKGIVPAQMKLAGILSDSFGDALDLPSAYVWFTIAEQSGDKLASALKMSVHRKLSVDQLAALKPRINEILREILTPPADNR